MNIRHYYPMILLVAALCCIGISWGAPRVGYPRVSGGPAGGASSSTGMSCAGNGTNCFTDGGIKLTTDTSGLIFENGTDDWQFRNVSTGGGAALGLYAGTTQYAYWDYSSGAYVSNFTISSLVASGSIAHNSLQGAKWCMGGATGCMTYDGTGFTMSVNLSETTHRGQITLSSGTGTATVIAGAICICQDTSAVPALLRCAVSGSTLTATETAGSNVISYICL